MTCKECRWSYEGEIVGQWRLICGNDHVDEGEILETYSCDEYEEQFTVSTGEEDLKCCRGFGLWATGATTPMGPIDAQDGMPTIPCDICGADANPQTETEKKDKEKEDMGSLLMGKEDVQE